MAIYKHRSLIDSLLYDVDGADDSRTFSFWLSPDVPSKFILGPADPKYYTGSISWVKVSKKYYWEAELVDVRIGGKSVMTGKAKVVFDSGTSMNSAPSSAFSTLLNRLGHRNLGCDSLSSMETVTYIVSGEGGAKHEFTLTPEEYSRKSSVGCAPQFMAMDVAAPKGPLWILG